MIYVVYAVRDSKARAFTGPFIATNDDMATRMMAMEMGKGESFLARFPEDFALYRLGEFDDVRGVLTGTEPVMVVQALAVKGGAL